MSEFAELDSVLDGMENPASETEQETTVESGEVETETETTEESGGESTDDNQQQEDPAQTKGAQAFAAMRSENTQLKNLVKKLAETLGVGDLQGDALSKALEDKIIARDAKANNIPEELQRKFQEQDNIIRAIAEERQKEQIVSAYTALQNECKLTNEQVYAFVQELQEKGYDMQKSLPHLADLYRGMHFTDLTQSMIDNAVQQALARQQKGATQSTKPDTKTGGVGESEDKIDTVAGLDALLKDVKL